MHININRARACLQHKYTLRPCLALPPHGQVFSHVMRRMALYTASLVVASFAMAASAHQSVATDPGVPAWLDAVVVAMTILEAISFAHEGFQAFRQGLRAYGSVWNCLDAIASPVLLVAAMAHFQRDAALVKMLGAIGVAAKWHWA